jgi:hypothetical protein
MVSNAIEWGRLGKGLTSTTNNNNSWSHFELFMRERVDEVNDTIGEFVLQVKNKRRRSRGFVAAWRPRVRGGMPRFQGYTFSPVAEKT